MATTARHRATGSRLRAAKYIAPTGSDTTGNGSIGNPWATLQYAHNQITGGGTIYMRGGTYPVSTWTNITKSGTSTAPTRIYAYPGETPVIDAAGMTSTAYYAGWPLVVSSANWVHIRGLTVTEGPMGGVTVRGTSANVTVEGCTAHHNGRLSDFEGSGFQVVDSAVATFLNCDGHHNQDINNSNADGFRNASTGSGTVFRGCRAWRNIDDGYDTYQGGPSTFEDCWAWENGYDDTLTWLGDGNGFKLGGGTFGGGHTVQRCVAWRNPLDGFGENDATLASTLYNNTGWDNGYNYSFWTQANTFRNNISYVTANAIGTNGTNSHNTWNLAVTVTDADFQSMDFSGTTGARGADYALPELTFLHLASGSDLIDKGVDVGLPYTGTAPDLGAFERP